MGVTDNMFYFMNGYCEALGIGFKWKIELTQKINTIERKKDMVKLVAWRTSIRNGCSNDVAPQLKHALYQLIIVNLKQEIVFVSEEISGQGQRRDRFSIKKIKEFLNNPKHEFRK